MSTLAVRLPKELIGRLRAVAKLRRISVNEVVRESLETALNKRPKPLLMKYAGVITGGPADLSSRKGFSPK
jgi:hypothetical protein